ncbi:MAG: hypothetical protein ABUT39_07670 [Acidobacteriota bacterium]
MSFDGMLFVKLLALLGAMQAVSWLLARGLGRRLPRHVMALGVALPLVLLFPWLDRGRLMVPLDLLQRMIPGAPAVPASHRHDLLNDAIYQFIPWELEVRHALSDRRLPLWSDSLEGGSSPWVNPQAQALSPIAMPARAVPIQHHLLAALALKILVAFEGAWLLARSAGVSRLSSLIAAGGFALSGGLIAWALFPHTAAAAWVPWLAAAVIRLFRGGGWRTVATAAILTAALLLSGHPEVAAVGGLFAGVCGLSLARWSRRGSFGRGLGKAAVAAALGFCLSAPQMLPFALYLPHSQRAEEMTGRTLPPYSVGLAPITWFVPGYGRFMMAPVSPRAYGIPFEDEFRGPINWVDSESGYAGIVAFAGSMVALFAFRRRKVWPFLGFGLASLLLAAQWIPLAHLIYAVSALRAIALARFLLVGCLALAIAGGMGLDALRQSRSRRSAALVGLIMAAALSLAAQTDAFTIALWVLIGLSVLAAWKRRAWGAAGFALVLLIDLVPWARGFLPSTNPALFYPRTDYMNVVTAEAATPGGPWRAVGEGQNLYPSLLPVYGVDELRPHNPLVPMPYLRTLQAAFGFAPTTINYFPIFGGIDHPFLDFLNVRVIASSVGWPPAKTLERIDGGRFSLFTVYRNPDALPRWFLPSGVDVISEADVARWIVSLKDPRRVAVFNPRAAAWTGQTGPVSVSFLSPGRVVLDVPGSGDRLLATSLNQPEGWTAAGMETLVVNGAFLGVHVPAGASKVELRFRPPGFLPGVLLGLAAFLATAVLLWRGT